MSHSRNYSSINKQSTAYKPTVISNRRCIFIMLTVGIGTLFFYLCTKIHYLLRLLSFPLPRSFRGFSISLSAMFSWFLCTDLFNKSPKLFLTHLIIIFLRYGYGYFFHLFVVSFMYFIYICKLIYMFEFSMFLPITLLGFRRLSSYRLLCQGFSDNIWCHRDEVCYSLNLGYKLVRSISNKTYIYKVLFEMDRTNYYPNDLRFFFVLFLFDL